MPAGDTEVQKMRCMMEKTRSRLGILPAVSGTSGSRTCHCCGAPDGDPPPGILPVPRRWAPAACPPHPAVHRQSPPTRKTRKDR